MEIVPVSDHRCQLGEGPLWDAADQALYWVDSLAPALFRHDVTGETTQRWDLPGRTVGSLAVRDNGGLILAMEQGFHAFDRQTGVCSLVASPMADRDDVRFNDGKVDRAGRFLAGGMNRDYLHDPDPKGVMVGLNPDLTVTPLLDGFVCFNGPCFSPDGATLYVTGRDMNAIEAFGYDPITSSLGAGRVLIADIDPDGATVDADGFIWSAQWDAACVLRITPDGAIDARIDVPGQVVSSVMFGGPDLDVLYVTTADKPIADGSHSPDAGRTLALRGTGFTGLAEPRFKG